jgi:mono/diheme cytochrome c family protein
MNYPIWDLPAAGLLIAAVAIVHVFVSHFAVGGGLFLVVVERKARRENDLALLAFVRRHTAFFVLLTLVFGAMTGVGIWFTIGLVHPQATATLINIFVWGWAIEWTFFVVEIAAAMVYFYGWDRLAPRTHLAVGWIYFAAAWLSLVVINGILSFMLTPGDWLVTRSFTDAILNPTYLPSVVARTAAAVGLAGLYAVLTAARLRDPALKARIGRYVTLRWILPMTVVLPASVLWFVHAAGTAGVPVASILGARDGSIGSVLDILRGGAVSGYPLAQAALRLAIGASVAGLLVCLSILARQGRYGLPSAAALMASGFLALGAGEWIREDLRKPYVIGHYMFVNGVRLPHASGAPPLAVADHFDVAAVNSTGVLAAARWRRLPDLGGAPADERTVAEGREVFRLLCSSCHTVNGHLGIAPLVRGARPAALETLLDRLAEPGGDWRDRPSLVTWRGRRMPPFTGTDGERRALAAYLAVLGGADRAGIAGAAAAGSAGERLFDEHCSMCHAADAEFPFDPKGRHADAFFELLGQLPLLNEAMPPFEGSEPERRALAEHLASRPAPPPREVIR